LGPAGAWSELSHGGNAHGVRSGEWLPVGVTRRWQRRPQPSAGRVWAGAGTAAAAREPAGAAGYFSGES